MPVNYRKLLKDSIRGQFVDWDDVSLPCRAVFNSDRNLSEVEKREFQRCMREVFAECRPERRGYVRRRQQRLLREILDYH